MGAEVVERSIVGGAGSCAGGGVPGVGLGTPGMHSYLIGVDGANAVVDAVVAAHQLAAAESSIQLDAEWFASGHSQGGQAALFATRARSRAPGYPLLGAVAIAPASQMPASTAIRVDRRAEVERDMGADWG